jgi:hypothetical protein
VCRSRSHDLSPDRHHAENSLERPDLVSTIVSELSVYSKERDAVSRGGGPFNTEPSMHVWLVSDGQAYGRRYILAPSDTLTSMTVIRLSASLQLNTDVLSKVSRIRGTMRATSRCYFPKLSDTLS